MAWLKDNVQFIEWDDEPLLFVVVLTIITFGLYIVLRIK